ncbi:MAG: hypothetical protein RLZZ367_1212 [Bacteroidota bacterium]|jgi:hypothetical protein
MKRRLFAVRLAAFLGLLVNLCGCIKDKEEINNYPATLKLQAHTIVTNGQTDTKLIDINATQLIYNGVPDQLSKAVSGDIVVSGITDMAPTGYLRKIVSVTQNGSRTVLNTTSATLEDAIEECNLSYNRPFAISDTFSGKKEDLGFGNEVNIILHDRDGSSSTTNDRIMLTGSYQMSPSLLCSLYIKHAQVKYLKLGMGLTENLDLHINANLYSSTLFEDEVVLANYPLAPIVMWVGSFPIVVRPVIKLKAGHETDINANVSAGWSGSAYQDAYIEYNQGQGWQVNSTKSITPTVAEHTLTGSVESEVYLKAEMEFILYDFEGVTSSLYAKSYINSEGTCTVTPSGIDDCNWNISAGFKAGGEVKAEVFGLSLIDYSADIFDYSKVIYTSGQSNGKIPITISNLQDNVTSLNDCWMDEANGYGSHFTMTFDINDPDFNVYDYFEIRSVGHFSNGVEDYDYLTSNSSAVTIVDNNTIRISWCRYFAAANYLDQDIAIFNSTYQSNTISRRIDRPSGANKNEGGTPWIRGIL